MTLRASAVIFVLLLPGAAAAQDDRGASVAGSVSATNMDARTSWSFAGSFEYRLNRVAGLEIETTVVPTLRSDFPDGPRILASSSVFSTSSLTSFSAAFFESSIIAPTIFPPPRLTNQRGRAVIFGNNVRVHIPTTTDRIDPYFVAGGGVASVRHTADLTYSAIALASSPPAGTVLPTLPIRDITQHLASSSVDLALTLGGGVGVRAMSRLWIEGDLRLFRLMGDEDRNVGRFGIAARYRF
jgi:hypothetical protein